MKKRFAAIQMHFHGAVFVAISTRQTQTTLLNTKDIKDIAFYIQTQTHTHLYKTHILNNLELDSKIFHKTTDLCAQIITAYQHFE